MAEFWNSLLTEKSWNVLTDISKEPFDFVLIGGWAAYMWTKLHKSKDIDIALTNIADLNYLKKKYNLKKNERLKKYEIAVDEVDIDIYVPHYSKLSLPTEDLKSLSIRKEGMAIIIPEALLILKQGAELDRKDSVKGAKDRIDIVTLLCFTAINWKLYSELLQKYGLNHFRARLKTIVSSFQDHNYLDLNPGEYKLRKKKILERISTI